MHQAKKLVNDRTFSDLVFEMKGGKKFNAHSFIVGARCDALIPAKVREQLTGRKKVRQHTIAVQDEKITAVALGALLDYLYTGVARLAQLTPKELIELYIAADFYKIVRLVWVCRSYFIEQLKLDTVFTMLRDATEYKCQVLKDVAKKFAFDNYTSVIGNKDGVKILGVDLFQEIVSGYATKEALNTGAEAEPPEPLLADYRSIYEKNIYPDAAAVTSKGEKLSFHRALIAVHSDVLAGLLREKEDLAHPVDMKRLSQEAFRAMQRYLYYGDDAIQPLLACELVSYGRDNELVDLVRVCKTM
jgi:hypothetical protein